ncbi:MAG: dihydrodipicolinate synthase family protein [Clostridiales bacterium]|nr:dihydrodipicolinate synthase family protein [Clostridiales bacterium]
MMREELSGFWPVMITPFAADGSIDYTSLERLIAWYEAAGARGLFAVCQSSEVFSLSLKERETLVSFIVKHAHVPVIASGHIAETLDDQLHELRRMRRAGADALIFISNRLAPENAPPERFAQSLDTLMNGLDPEIPLGFYECPYPYKRLLSLDELKRCADSGRFYFMKDTCCDIGLIKKRLRVIAGSNLRLFNANTTTLLASLREGAAGFSGVMTNFHPELYHWLLCNWQARPEEAETLQAFLTAFSLIERQAYPINAKYHLQAIVRVIRDIYTRAEGTGALSATFRDEVEQVARAADRVGELLKKGALYGNR